MNTKGGSSICSRRRNRIHKRAQKNSGRTDDFGREKEMQSRKDEKTQSRR